MLNGSTFIKIARTIPPAGKQKIARVGTVLAILWKNQVSENSSSIGLLKIRPSG